MNPNAHIVILVFDEVVPRYSETATDIETTAQTLARRYQESDETGADDLDSRGLRCLHSRDFKIVH